MSEAREKFECPHCGTELQAFELPEAGGWDEPHHFACFNDECSYFKNGWDWMMAQYEARTSFRYRVNPDSGVASPIAVWSKAALRDRIVKKNNNPPQ